MLGLLISFGWAPAGTVDNIFVGGGLQKVPSPQKASPQNNSKQLYGRHTQRK